MVIDSDQPRPDQTEVASQTPEGVRVTFVSPELLRAYILDPQTSQRASTLAERMSGIREIRLGEFPLDGKFFQSTYFTLVIEPDKDPRGQKPTAIIRADLKLGPMHSELTVLQADRASNPDMRKSDDDSLPLENVFENIPFQETPDMSLTEWSRNLRFISRPIEREVFYRTPLALLQLWDKDVGVGLISLSLVNWGRFSMDWRERFSDLERKTLEGWEVDSDEADRWQFRQPVGVEVHDLGAFRESLTFYGRAFNRILQALYQSEGLATPNLNLVIEPPLIFREEDIVRFEDIGGQADAVQFLRAQAHLAKSGIRVEPVILVGPPGFGKSSLTQAFATELGVPMIKKTSNDLPPEVTEEGVKRLLRAGYLEAQAAAKRIGGRAVYCLENLEFILLGSNGRLHDFMINEMDRWVSDEVVLMITTNDPNRIHGGIMDRGRVILVAQPDRQGMREIVQIHTAKIAKILGRDIFSGLDLDRVAARLRDRGISGRGTKKLLNDVYSISRQQGQAITTDLFLSLLDSLIPQRRIGFSNT